ncbi:unnamed protein product [Amaranthus hypochondriacus]
MVGTRGKGSRSQTKDGEGEKNDISNTIIVPLEEQVDKIISAFSDGAEEKEQSALEVDDIEKDISTEMDVDRTEEKGQNTIEVREVGDQGHSATGCFKDNEGLTNVKKLEQDEAPSKGLDINSSSIGDDMKMIAEDQSAYSKSLVSSDPGAMENMTETEIHEEPSKFDGNELVGMPSKQEEECTKENVSITDDIKDVTGNNRPKRKVIKKKLVKKTVNKKIPQPSTASSSFEDNEGLTNEKKPEEEEAPLEGLDKNSARTREEKQMITEDLSTCNKNLVSSDPGVMENMAEAMEIHEEPNKLDANELVSMPSKREEECTKENVSITDDIKDVTEKVNKPKRKVIKKKLVKKKMLKMQAATVSKEIPQPSPTASGSFEDNEGLTNEKKLEDNEAPLEGLDKINARTGDEMLMIAEDLSTCNKHHLVSSDPGVMEKMAQAMEIHGEPSKLDADELIGMPSERKNNFKEENASITDDIRDITRKDNRPKRKVIKKKLVKKMVRKQPAIVNKEIPQPSEKNNTPEEAFKVDTNEHVNNEKTSDVYTTLAEECKDNNDHEKGPEKAKVKTPVKIKKKPNVIRKKKALQSHSSVATVKSTEKPQSGNEELASVEINKPELENEVVDKSGDKTSPSKGSKKKNMVKMGSQEKVAKDANKSNPSKEGKSSKKVDSMGMIFMCSSDTKKDCYRYKVLGLPAGKKENVLKIYKGMRLFLFDVDLRMMYGIYKAAGPGGYNIEPRAFKSQFPSQVRFSILEDCVPLAEEKFKKVLKDNYYTKNKFDFQLNSEQVKNLCKLFHETSKKAKSTKTAGGSQRALATNLSAKAANSSRKAATVQAASTSRSAAVSNSSAHRDRKRKRVEDSSRGAARHLQQERSRRVAREEIRRAPLLVPGREEIRHAPLARADREIVRCTPLVVADRYYEHDREEIRRAPLVVVDREEMRRAPMVVTDRYYERPVYERESYPPAVAPAPLYQSLPAYTTTYSYDRVSEADDSYRRNTVIDHRDLIPSSRESRLPIERDSYLLREPAQVYNGLTYRTSGRGENYDYTSDGRYTEYHRAAESRPPLPLYRRY